MFFAPRFLKTGVVSVEKLFAGSAVSMIEACGVNNDSTAFSRYQRAYAARFGPV